MNIGGNGMILVRSELEYSSGTIRMDQSVLPHRRAEKHQLCHGIPIEKQPEITASKGRTVLVSFDYETRKVTRLPEVFRQKVKEFEGL